MYQSLFSCVSRFSRIHVPFGFEQERHKYVSFLINRSCSSCMSLFSGVYVSFLAYVSFGFGTEQERVTVLATRRLRVFHTEVR